MNPESIARQTCSCCDKYLQEDKMLCPDCVGYCFNCMKCYRHCLHDNCIVVENNYVKGKAFHSSEA